MIKPKKAARIIQGIKSRSPRILDISAAMPADMRANYKSTHRFIEEADTKQALNRLYYEPTPFIIRDPTEIAKRHV